jgi:hypothetical protein
MKLLNLPFPSPRDTISSLAETAVMSPKNQKIGHLLSERRWPIFCVDEYVLLFHHHFHHIFKLLNITGFFHGFNNFIGGFIAYRDICQFRNLVYQLSNFSISGHKIRPLYLAFTQAFSK